MEIIKEEKMKNIILVDNQQIFVEGLRQLLDLENSFQVVKVASNYSEILALDLDGQLDLLLIDIDIFQQVKEKMKVDIIERLPDTKIVVLATTADKCNVSEIILSGVHGYLLKEMSVEHFYQALEMIMDGTLYIHPKMTHELIADYRKVFYTDGKSNRINEIQQPVHLCTKRECEILQLITNGNTNHQISQALGISEKTVKNHISNIFRKINVNGRTEAVVLAIRNEWVRI